METLKERINRKHCKGQVWTKGRDRWAVISTDAINHHAGFLLAVELIPWDNFEESTFAVEIAPSELISYAEPGELIPAVASVYDQWVAFGSRIKVHDSWGFDRHIANLNPEQLHAVEEMLKAVLGL